MPPLDAAIALPEMANGTAAIPGYLHLNMPRSGQILLEIDISVAKGRLGLGLANFVRRRQFFDCRYRTHAATATTGRGLDHHRTPVTERRHKGLGIGQRSGALGSSENRDASFMSERARRARVTEKVESFRLRSDKGQACCRAIAGETGILREEPIAGMHRIAAGLLRRGDYCRAIEISGDAPALQRHRIIGHLRVKRGFVVLRIDCNSGETRVGSAADDTNGNLAAIGDQHAFKTH